MWSLAVLTFNRWTEQVPLNYMLLIQKGKHCPTVLWLQLNACIKETTRLRFRLCAFVWRGWTQSWNIAGQLRIRTQDLWRSERMLITVSWCGWCKNGCPRSYNTGLFRMCVHLQVQSILIQVFTVCFILLTRHHSQVAGCPVSFLGGPGILPEVSSQSLPQILV